MGTAASKIKNYLKVAVAASELGEKDVAEKLYLQVIEMQAQEMVHKEGTIRLLRDVINSSQARAEQVDEEDEEEQQHGHRFPNLNTPCECGMTYDEWLKLGGADRGQVQRELADGGGVVLVFVGEGQ